MMYHERYWLQCTIHGQFTIETKKENTTNEYKEITSGKAGEIVSSKSEVWYCVPLKTFSYGNF